MKHRCKWCKQEIEITQSDKAKTGMKKLTDHEGECFKKHFPRFGQDLVAAMDAPKQDLPKVPEKYDMQGVIEYLHKSLGRIPNESECLRFNMFILSCEKKPTPMECNQFVALLKRI